MAQLDQFIKEVRKWMRKVDERIENLEINGCTRKCKCKCSCCNPDNPDKPDKKYDFVVSDKSPGEGALWGDISNETNNATSTVDGDDLVISDIGIGTNPPGNQDIIWGDTNI